MWILITPTSQICGGNLIEVIQINVYAWKNYSRCNFVIIAFVVALNVSITALNVEWLEF